MSLMSSSILAIFLLSLLSDKVLTESTDQDSSEPDVSPKAVIEPNKDKHGIWILNDDLFDPFLDAHPNVAILFSDDSLFSYAGKYHFDRAAHILRDLRNSTIEFAVLEGGGYSDSSPIHKEMNFEFYPQIKYCHHDHLSPLIRNESESPHVQGVEGTEWEIRCLDYNHHIIELQVVQWVEGLHSRCSLLIEDK